MLDRLSAAEQLRARGARESGLHARARTEIAPTEMHVGSTVVMLRA